MERIRVVNRPRLKVVAILVAITIAIFGFLGSNSEPASASASGPTNSHTNAPGEANCTVCHTEFPVNSGVGEVLIEGLPQNYLPNQEIPITVTVNDADAVIYGFQMTAIDSEGRRIGTYTLPMENPQEVQTISGFVEGNLRDYIQHTSAGTIPTEFGTKSWSFTWTAPPVRVGKIGFYAAGNAADSSGSTNGDYIYTTSTAMLSGTSISNFDGDLVSDIAVFRPSAGVWYTLNTVDNNFQAILFGQDGDINASADYDGDGVDDPAVFRPSTGVWYVRKSTGGFIITQFGTDGDIPVVGDYDGDLKSDLAVWRPSDGGWYILRSSDSNVSIVTFGLPTDKIAQADYDADGKTDIAVWRPSTGAWYVLRSTNGTFFVIAFGNSTDRTAQADFDGDGRTDLGIFRPSESTWYLLRSTEGFAAIQFGASSDEPVPADYDGDGKSDIAVWRPSNGAWYILRSSDSSVAITVFGLNGDRPVPAGYLSD